MIKEYIAYIKDNPEGYWFKRKLYGWGWTPATKEGWLIICGYIVAILAFAFTIDPNSSDREVVFTFLLPVVLLTISLFRICYKKGEVPRWQWGIPDKYKKGTNRSANTGV